MTISVKEWELMPELEPALPWVGKETGFTLNEVIAVCPKCKTQLQKMRGNVYEYLGVVEMNMAGVCPKCRLLVPCRSRIYPEKHGLFTFAQLTDKGWEKARLGEAMTKKQLFWKEAFGVWRPASLGLLIGISASLAGTNPTKWTYIFWGMAAAFMVGLGLVVGWMVSRKRGG